MKYLSRISAILVTAVFAVIPIFSPVLAEENKTVLPLHCDPGKGIYKPTETLIIVPLDKTLYRLPGEDAEDIAKSIFYEFTYVRRNNSSPFNAVMVDGKLAYAMCDFIDSTANVLGFEEKEGAFVLGTYGQLSIERLQELIDQYKTSNIKTAEILYSEEEKNTVVTLANISECKELCNDLSLVSKGVNAREHELEVGSPNYATSVRQQEQLSFSLKIKNTSGYPLYAEGKNLLVITPTTSGLSNLYHSSWLSTDRVATLSGPLLPGAETILTATLGAPLLPGKYSESMRLIVGGTKVSEDFKVAFTVEKDNLKLAKIIPKGGEPYANLRATPSLKGNLAGKIDSGTYVIIRGYQDAWVKIETKEGKVAWVYKPFVREL